MLRFVRPLSDINLNAPWDLIPATEPPAMPQVHGSCMAGGAIWD